MKSIPAFWPEQRWVYHQRRICQGKLHFVAGTYPSIISIYVLVQLHCQFFLFYHLCSNAEINQQQYQSPSNKHRPRRTWPGNRLNWSFRSRYMLQNIQNIRNIHLKTYSSQMFKIYTNIQLYVVYFQYTFRGLIKTRTENWVEQNSSGWWRVGSDNYFSKVIIISQKWSLFTTTYQNFWKVIIIC